MDVSEKDGRARSVRKGRDSALEVDAVIDSVRPGARRSVDRAIQAQSLAATRVGTDALARTIDRDAAEPGGERTVSAEAGDLSPRRDEGLEGDVFRTGRVTREAKGEGVHAALVAVKQFLERLLDPLFPGQPRQVGVGEITQVGPFPRSADKLTSFRWDRLRVWRPLTPD